MFLPLQYIMVHIWSFLHSGVEISPASGTNKGQILALIILFLLFDKGLCAGCQMDCVSFISLGT